MPTRASRTNGLTFCTAFRRHPRESNRLSGCVCACVRGCMCKNAVTRRGAGHPRPRAVHCIYDDNIRRTDGAYTERAEDDVCGATCAVQRGKNGSGGEPVLQQKTEAWTDRVIIYARRRFNLCSARRGSLVLHTRLSYGFFFVRKNLSFTDDTCCRECVIQRCYNILVLEKKKKCKILYAALDCFMYRFS